MLNFELTLGAGLEIALMIVGALITLIGLVSLGVSVWLGIKYYKFNRKENSVHMTAEQVARKVLDDNDLEHIKVKATGSVLFGNSYSHYKKYLHHMGKLSKSFIIENIQSAVRLKKHYCKKAQHYCCDKHYP